MTSLFVRAASPGPTILGTDAIKVFLTKVFKALPIDKDGDGVEGGEIASALFQIVPAILDKDILLEAKELTTDELAELTAWAGKYFPEFAEYPVKVEDVVVAALQVVNGLFNLWVAAAALGEDGDPLNLAGDESPAVAAQQRHLDAEELAILKSRPGAEGIEGEPGKDPGEVVIDGPGTASQDEVQ